MAAPATYNPASSSDLNRGRRARAGTGGRGWAFTDVEINDWISDRGTWQGAVAEGYRVLAGKVARHAQDYSNAEGSVNQTANYELLSKQAEEWERRHAAAVAASADSILPRAVVGYLGYAPSDPNYRRS